MEPIIKVYNLNYTYPDGKFGIENIVLDISEGECVGIIGPNGAGKTTLLLCLIGILKGNGEITICKTALNENISEIRKRVQIVFQNPDEQLFMPSVFDDVSFGPINMGLSREVVEKRVSLALEEVGMLGFEERCPHHLSIGEKKRIAIASALSINPDILLLDEPSANLDPRMRKSLIELLSSLKKTMLIATHDIEMINRLCKRVFVMDKGRIVKSGNTKELLQDFVYV